MDDHNQNPQGDQPMQNPGMPTDQGTGGMGEEQHDPAMPQDPGTGMGGETPAMGGETPEPTAPTGDDQGTQHQG